MPDHRKDLDENLVKAFDAVIGVSSSMVNSPAVPSGYAYGMSTRGRWPNTMTCSLRFSVLT